jgi:hypothetical protein
MRFQRHAVLAVVSSALAALLTISGANAALLFQDRHAANGQETIYRFEANALSATATVEQSKAVKMATVWATQYYGVRVATIANAQERMMPIHFWLIALTASERGKNALYYAVVLPNGSLVEPKVSRQSMTASADSIDVAKDTELAPPVQNLEIHGEIDFSYGWGRGLRGYGPFIPNPLWDLPYGPLH